MTLAAAAADAADAGAADAAAPHAMACLRFAEGHKLGRGRVPNPNGVQ